MTNMDNNSNQEESPIEKQEELDLEDGEIEDDDEDTLVPDEPAAPVESPKTEIPLCSPPSAEKNKAPIEVEKNTREKNRDRPERRRHDEGKGKKHMTEAEKSILHLRKREEMQRKKWEKMNRIKDVEPEPDDFAKNIEKTLATILNKKEKEAAGVSGGEEKEKEKDEERRGRKRRKHEKERKEKHKRLESPRSEVDENEILNIRGGSPERRFLDEKGQPSPAFNSEESVDSEYSSDRSKTDDRNRRNREFRKGSRKNRDRNHHRSKKRDREREAKNNDQQEQSKDSQGVCVFYLQGKCLKTDCTFSHEAVPPMKLELCKFYLMDCCAKGDKCSYMHSEFPCKFYHAGLSCAQGENCKFAHGKPLSDGLKQTLFKHIETAPRDLLSGFPRMTREEALNLINQTQVKLQEQLGMVQEENNEVAKGGIPSLFDINVPIPPELLQGHDGGKLDKANRHRPSRWQDADNSGVNDASYPLKPFNYGKDQDMRINSNGDVDMRTLPPLATPILTGLGNSASSENNDIDIEMYKRESGLLGTAAPLPNFNFPISKPLSYSTQDTDIRTQPLMPASKDVDIRQLPSIFNNSVPPPSFKHDEDEPMLQIDSGEDQKNILPDVPAHLPKTQRDLFLRIQSQQKETSIEAENKEDYSVPENINWYSDDDDDDDNRLTIKVDNEDIKEKEEQPEMPSVVPSSFASLLSPPSIKPMEMVEKLGDLSKIDISAEVTKLLTSMSQARNQLTPQVISTPEKQSPAPIVHPSSTPPPVSTDPRVSRQDPRKPVDKADQVRSDPRLQPASNKQRSRQSSVDNQKSEKLSIYEQGSLDRKSNAEADIDIRGMRSDVDLRNLQLPFKGMQNYTPCSEIDASINSHPPIQWKVVNVDIPRPDYTGLKLSISDAEKTGDPRLRKIFRLSTEERDTPLSPKASPKASTNIRVDPRLKKIEETKPDVSGAPMNYAQQLTILQSSAFYQSLTSNQKLLLNQELSQRNDSNSYDPVLNTLLSNLNIIPSTTPSSTINMGAAQSILSNISKLNPMLGPQVQPPNLPVNPALLGQMTQSINQPGLLGAAPGVPNLPSINFDPRNGGLLGNAPPLPSFGGFPPPESQGNFNNYDDYYPPEGGNVGNFQGGNRDNRPFNRDRRRGRNFNGRGNRNFRNNRNRINRHHSPP